MADMGVSAVVGAGASLLGGALRSRANTEAGQTGAMLGLQSLMMQQGMWNQVRDILGPFVKGGVESLDTLRSAMTGTGAADLGIGGGGPNLLSTFRPTMEQLEKTPGYQWSLDQGLKAVQNSAAAKGLGLSGNAVKAGADYTLGASSNLFQQSLKNYMDQNKQAYEMLFGPAELGGRAGGALAQGAVGMAGQMGDSYKNIAGSMMGGTMGSANALADSYSSLGGYMPAGMRLRDLPGQVKSTYNLLSGIPQSLGFGG